MTDKTEKRLGEDDRRHRLAIDLQDGTRIESPFNFEQMIMVIYTNKLPNHMITFDYIKMSNSVILEKTMNVVYGTTMTSLQFVTKKGEETITESVVECPNNHVLFTSKNENEIEQVLTALKAQNSYMQFTDSSNNIRILMLAFGAVSTPREDTI